MMISGDMPHAVAQKKKTRARMSSVSLACKVPEMATPIAILRD
jgi:hypothetical protein